MPKVIWATPLYKLLRYCEDSPLEKVVLDCGAGGSDPPLQLFCGHGYRTCGIDIQQEAVNKAREFSREQSLPLNIFLGDMRAIPFADKAFAFVYAFNAIFFLTKPDIALAMREIERVLAPNGLCFVNFISVDNPDRRPFCETAYARRLLGGERWAEHQDNEADCHFDRFLILHKEKRIVDKVHGQGRLVQVYIDYIARKNGLG
jgi:SAM-dependent methyltransferase